MVVAPFVFRAVAAVVVYPVVKVEQWFLNSSAALPTYFKSRAALDAEINTLEQTLQETITIPEETARLEEENTTLRALLGADLEVGILAGVSIRPPFLPYDNFLIDSGRAHGVTEGAPVYAGKNIVVGIVSVVYEKSAIVTLVSTPGFKSTAYIIGPNIYTTARGIGNGVLEIGVPQGIVLAMGDAVILPALQPGVFGSLSAIVSSATDPEQFAYVSQPIPLQSLRYVRVGREALPETDFETVQDVIKGLRVPEAEVLVPDGILVDIVSTTTGTSSLATTSSSAL